MLRFEPRSFLSRYAIRREKWRDARDKQGYWSRSTCTVATCTYGIYLVFIRHKLPPPTCNARDRQGCIISLMARLVHFSRLSLRSLRVHRTFVALMEMQIIGRRKGSRDERGGQPVSHFSSIITSSSSLYRHRATTAFSSFFPPFRVRAKRNYTGADKRVRF